MRPHFKIIIDDILSHLHRASNQGLLGTDFWKGDTSCALAWRSKYYKPMLPKITLVQWKPPLVGWVKLNYDGICKGNPGMAGAGAINRDYSGIPLAATPSFFGEATNIQAELLAVAKIMNASVRYC